MAIKIEVDTKPPTHASLVLRLLTKHAILHLHHHESRFYMGAFFRVVCLFYG